MGTAIGDELVDEKYYQVVAPRSLSERLLIAARDRIYEDFLRLTRPVAADTILDVGVSDVINEGANLLERKYPHGERITAVGLGEAREFQAAFPRTAYRQVQAGAPLPFADDTFDIATSNAVLEHVGSHSAQVAFVNELLRVARRVFITVPHRFFPVEHHTAIPFLHYTDTSFALACRALGKDEWTDPKNLILMSRLRLAGLVPRGVSSLVGNTGLLLGPMSSNLYLFATRTGPIR
jgi:SAM-dependent methyltransferase